MFRDQILCWLYCLNLILARTLLQKLGVIALLLEWRQFLRLSVKLNKFYQRNLIIYLYLEFISLTMTGRKFISRRIYFAVLFVSPNFQRIDTLLSYDLLTCTLIQHIILYTVLQEKLLTRGARLLNWIPCSSSF